jgi:hypothetical protein
MSRPWEDKPGELATSFGSGRRRQKVIRGTDMVTPERPLVMTENGRTEELIPGRDRLSKRHPLVVKNPELFRPCDPEDIETIRNHRKLAERKLKRLGGTTRADTRPQKKFSLGPERSPEYRLP